LQNETTVILQLALSKLTLFPKETNSMISVKNKVSETAEHMKNVVTETVDKVAHAASEALHKGDHALSDMARKAVGLAAETRDKVKETAPVVAAKPQGAPAALGDIPKTASDKIKAARDKAKKTAN
jgi:hypothetical protein